MYLTSLRIE